VAAAYGHGACDPCACRVAAPRATVRLGFDLSEVARSDGPMAMLGVRARMTLTSPSGSSRSTTSYVCAETHEAPHEQVRPKTSNRTRTFSGLFVPEPSAFSPSPLRPSSKAYVLQLMDPTFANEFVGLKTVFFQGLGAGDGNRTHDIQLGKLSFYH
jgi:hypothetical protein